MTKKKRLTQNWRFHHSIIWNGEKASINVLQTLSKTITHHSVILIPDLFERETRSNELSGSRLNKQEKKLDGQCTGASCNLSHKALFLDKTNTGTWNFF